MNFIFLITNLAGGGAEKAILKIAAGMANRGHQATVLLLENRIEHNIPEGVQVAALTQSPSKGWLGKRLLAWRLRRSLRLDSDLVISTLPFTDEVAILARLPRHWCRIANTLGSEVQKMLGWSLRKGRRRLLRYRRLYGARPLIAVSAGLAHDLIDSIGTGSRIEIIPNPFDFESIRHEGEAACSTELPRQPYILHIGRFVPQKRHDLLLDAWASIEDLPLLVLLTAFNSKLQQMIYDRGLADRVVIAGFQPNPYPWIAGAQLLVLCSDHEGLPNVLIESLICRTPAVSTDCPSGPREILAAFPECLVPCGDVTALSNAIVRTLATPPDLGKANLGSYEMDHILDAYERLAAEP